MGKASVSRLLLLSWLLEADLASKRNSNASHHTAADDDKGSSKSDIKGGPRWDPQQIKKNRSGPSPGPHGDALCHDTMRVCDSTISVLLAAAASALAVPSHDNSSPPHFSAPLKMTFASADPVAAANFVVRYLGAKRAAQGVGKDGNGRYTCLHTCLHTCLRTCRHARMSLQLSAHTSTPDVH